MCAGQILGVRMALLGLERLGIADPRGADRKRLVTYVEIDRCATDAIALVTGCRLGKRALKFRDWGKMAATFVDLAIGPRPFALSRSKIRESSPTSSIRILRPKSQQQMQAYRELPDDKLFREQWVRVAIEPCRSAWLLSGSRCVCPRCGEGVNFGRFALVNGERLCLSCAHPELRYWEPED